VTGNSKTREIIIPVALAVSLGVIAISGGIVFGQTQQRLTDHEKRLTFQEQVNEKVQEIWRKQGIIESKIIALTIQLHKFEAKQEETLGRILEQTRGRTYP